MGVIQALMEVPAQLSIAKEQNRHNAAISWAQMNHEKELAERQFNYNKTLAEEEYNRNIEQWQRENEYNLPANQMLRYQQAGLNPNLIYGQSNTSASSPVYHSPTYHENSTQLPPYSTWNGKLSPFNLLSDIFQLMNFKNMLDKGKAEATIAKNNAVSSGYDATMKGELSAYFGAFQEAKLHNLLMSNENAELRNEWQSFLNSTKDLRKEIMETTKMGNSMTNLINAHTLNSLNRYGFDPSKGNWTNWLGGFATNLIDKLIY